MSYSAKYFFTIVGYRN